MRIKTKIVRITSGKRSRRFQTSDRNRANGVVRVFGRFLSRITGLTFRRGLSRINSAMIDEQSINLWGKEYPQPILGNSYVVSRGTGMQIGYVHERIVTVHGGSRWKQSRQYLPV